MNARKVLQKSKFNFWEKSKRNQAFFVLTTRMHMCTRPKNFCAHGQKKFVHNFLKYKNAPP